MVESLHLLHELGLSGDVKIVGAGFDAGGDDGLAVEAEGADAVEEEPGAAGEGEE